MAVDEPLTLVIQRLDCLCKVMRCNRDLFAFGFICWRMRSQPMKQCEGGCCVVSLLKV